MTSRPSSSVASSSAASIHTYSYWFSALATSSDARPVRSTFVGQRRPRAELSTIVSPSTSDQTSVAWIEPSSLSVATWQKLRPWMSSRTGSVRVLRGMAQRYASLLRGRLHQRPGAMGDLRREHDVARRAPDRRRAEQPVDDLLQLLGVVGRDATQQVARAARRVGLEHLWNRFQVRDGLDEPPLGDLQEDEGEDRIADLRRVDLRAEAADDPAFGELGQTRLHGAARDVEPPRDLHEADARLVGHEGDEAGVELVDGTGHVAQNLPRFTRRCWAS